MYDEFYHPFFWPKASDLEPYSVAETGTAKKKLLVCILEMLSIVIAFCGMEFVLIYTDSILASLGLVPGILLYSIVPRRWPDWFRIYCNEDDWREESRSNARAFPCPECGQPNHVTLRDTYLGYKCPKCIAKA